MGFATMFVALRTPSSSIQLTWMEAVPTRSSHDDGRVGSVVGDGRIPDVHDVGAYALGGRLPNGDVDVAAGEVDVTDDERLGRRGVTDHCSRS